MPEDKKLTSKFGTQYFQLPRWWLQLGRWLLSQCVRGCCGDVGRLSHRCRVRIVAQIHGSRGAVELSIHGNRLRGLLVFLFFTAAIERDEMTIESRPPGHRRPQEKEYPFHCRFIGPLPSLRMRCCRRPPLLEKRILFPLPNPRWCGLVVLLKLLWLFL